MTDSQSTHHTDHTGATYARGRLFLLSVIALATAGVFSAIRAASIADMETQFFKTPFPGQSAAMIGAVVGAAFLGFALSIFVGSPLCDYLGMNRLLGLASVMQIVATVGTILAPTGLSAYYILWGAMFAAGLAQGLVEAVINPLIATIYPDDKTHRLNVLHAWWPGGLVIGGLIGFGLGPSGFTVAWQIRLAVVVVPAVIYGFMVLSTKFPPTERMAAGVSAGAMWREILNPAFILLFVCMMGTAASELAPGQWVDSVLTRIVGFQGILLLVYISALMFVMRHFAGSLAHRLSPVGLMAFSCLLAAIGLFLLSSANSPILALGAATVWGVGVCYMWPTMLGITSERFPRGGALAMGLMGCAGNLSIYFVLPWMGRIFDTAKLERAGGDAAFKALQGATDAASKAKLNEALSHASTVSFQSVAILPAVILFVFILWWLYDKSKGGYKAVKLETGIGGDGAA